MAVYRVRLSFVGEQIKDPVIYELGHKFDLVTNIRRADVTSSEGWVLLELRGEDDEIRRGIEWVAGCGVRVEPVGGDLIEG